MNIIDLIEYISESDETGLLKIKPYEEVNYEQIKSVVVYNLETVNLIRHGDMIFNDDVWRGPVRAVDFSNLAGTIRYEVKSAFILANYSGLFEGGQGNKFDSVCIQILPLIKFGVLIQSYGFKSIAEFNNSDSLIKRNCFIKFITKTLKITNNGSDFNRRFFEENLNYGLFTDETIAIFTDELEKANISYVRNKKTKSYPIVPSDLLKKVIGECELRFTEAKNVIDSWETANNHYVDAIRNVTDNGKVYSTVSALISKKRNVNLFVDPLRKSYEKLDNLKLNVLLYILAYTGMRKDEALSCVIGCSAKHDGKYYLEAVLTKTDETKKKMKWIANKDTYDAVKLLERYVKGMHRRAEAILENPEIKITDKLEHQLKHGLNERLLFGIADYLTSVKFTDAKLGVQSSTHINVSSEKEPKFSLHKFEYQLTAHDIDQLESLSCNYKSVRGYNKGKNYIEGEIFRITPHMLRHNFAWFIIANRLGELDDIKHQFKHLASSMTMVYASRGYESADEMVGLFEDFEEILVDNIAQSIANDAAEGTLTGEAGKRFNDGAQSLVFNVTASNASDTGRTVKQIHFSSLLEYQKFLTQNLKNIRGLPHGYCTAGSECKLKNVGLPSGCVYCPNYLVTEKQRVQWRAMKSFADGKLEIYNKLPLEQQSEYSLMAESWRDTSNAALVILTDRTPLRVEGIVA